MPSSIYLTLLLFLCFSCQERQEQTSSSPPTLSQTEPQKVSREARQKHRRDSIHTAYLQSFAYIKNVDGLTGLGPVRLGQILDSLPLTKVPLSPKEVFFYDYPAHWEASFDTQTGEESGDTISQNKVIHLENHLSETFVHFRTQYADRHLDLMKNEEGKTTPYYFRGILRKNKAIYSLLYSPYSIINVDNNGIILDKMDLGMQYLEGGEGDTHLQRYVYLDASDVLHTKKFKIRYVSDVMDAYFLGHKQFGINEEGKFIKKVETNQPSKE